MGAHVPADDRRSMIATIKQRVAGGDYRVDTHAVADAILTRERASDPLQALCSQMLVAAKASGRTADELEPFADDDAS